jgi:hypothetical protein
MFPDLEHLGSQRLQRIIVDPRHFSGVCGAEAQLPARVFSSALDLAFAGPKSRSVVIETALTTAFTFICRLPDLV